MKLNDIMQRENAPDFAGIENSYFLLGLLSAFDNRFQAVADKLIGEISWKQFFAIICINLFKEAPSISELAEIMGSSHQNVKQILLKLEKKGFVSIEADISDKRCQRVVVTEECRTFCENNDERSNAAVSTLFKDISEEELRTTVGTIMKMENNLDDIK